MKHVIQEILGVLVVLAALGIIYGMYRFLWTFAFGIVAVFVKACSIIVNIFRGE